MSSTDVSRSEYAEFYQAISDAVLSVDREGRIFAANRAAASMFGYSRKQLTGQSVETLVPERLRASHPKHREFFLEHPKVREMGVATGLHAVRKDGEEVPVDVRLIPIGTRAEGGVHCILRDLRVYRATESRLRQNAAHQTALAELGQRMLAQSSLKPVFDDAVATLAASLDTDQCKVLQLDADGKTFLLVAGVGWKQGIVGRARVEAGIHSQAGYTLHTDDPVIVSDLRSETRFDGPSLLNEHDVVSGMSVIIRGVERPWGILGVHTNRLREFSKEDVHFLQAVANLLGMAVEREEAEESRQQSEERARSSQRLEAIGRLAGGISHDINNVLTIILNYVDLLDEGQQSEAVDGIRSAAERAASLTHQLLTFSRRQILEPRLLDINLEISEIEKMLQRVIGEDVALVTSLSSDLGRVHADASQIHQIILNMAVNARDALPEGGRLTIETANTEIVSGEAGDGGSGADGQLSSLPPGSYVAIRVRDTGVGMDAETRSRVFEPFFTTKGAGGTGLGLATVYGIVKQSGGSIHFDSKQGQGTSFEILLPRVSEAAAAVADEPDIPVELDGSETVLLVEDDDAVRHLLCRMLEKHGYLVLEARGPLEAMEISDSHRSRISIVVTDMVMPKMSGAELVRRLREKRPDVSVLVISGYAGDALDGAWLRENRAAFLSKPFTSQRLAKRVRELLDGWSVSRDGSRDGAEDPAQRDRD